MRAKGAIRGFDELRDAVFAFRRPRIILTALELDLFSAIGRRAWAVPALARKLDVSPRGLSILCRNLASAGLLTPVGVRYRNSPFAARELDATSPAFRSAYLDLIRTQWDDWSQLTDCVRTGRPVEHEDPDDPAYRRSFSWAMHQRSLEVAPRVARALDLRGARTLLDLGGGPGTYALEFLARNPGLRAAVCDRPPALEVARELAAKSRHGRRLDYLPVDFMCQPIPGRYDVVWLSNVIHIYGPEENRRLFRRILAALAPGGRLLIQDAFTLDQRGLQPAEANLFAVTMLLFTETGDTYDAEETCAWLRKAGFERVRRLRLRGAEGDWEGGLLEAWKPRRPRGSRGRRAGSAGSSGRR
jgi:SAM-dependent methyltransferase